MPFIDRRLDCEPWLRNTTDKIHALTLAGGPMTDNPDLGPYKVRTRAYDYALRDAHDQPLVTYHWHPPGKSTYHAPHFHLPPQWPGIHFPCERTSLESIVRLCLEELGAQPARADWRDILHLNEGRFKLYRSWTTTPELAKPARR